MKKVSRLAEIFMPEHYDLHIDLHNEADNRFSGIVDITGRLRPNQTTIILHAKDLVIKSVNVDGKSADFEPGEHDELRITHPDLSPGRHIVTLEFAGNLTDPMHGIYPCYFRANGEEGRLIATQFESHHAREAFPCVDEPAAKATFRLTLTSQPDVTVLSNTRLKNQQLEDGRLVSQFFKTPRMSSYLLAFVIGDMHKKTALTKRGVEVNAWATPAQPADTLDFALDIATRSIDFFEEYFGVDYPLEKLDNVALPDFSSGAMENWGLVTYRESAMLADPRNTSAASKRHIATVITHELSHQWFGNLVTMEWWNDLWLNESFANLMEYVAVDALEPDWRIWEDWATSEVTAALRRDSLDGVQAVKTDVNHPDEISTLFDGAIVYAKGGRLLKMARELVGDQAFRRGLKDYFEKFAYGNTVGDDLWRCLEAASGQPIKEMMNAWISNPGLPQVQADYCDDDLKVSQERLFVGEHQPDQTVWPIPLFTKNSVADDVLVEKQATYQLDQPALLNHNLAAHFVTNFDPTTRQSLLAQASSGQLDTLDSIGLLQDIPILVRAGKLSSAELLPLALSFKDETNEKVFTMAAAALGELRKFGDNDGDIRRGLKLTSIDFAKSTYERLGWDRHDDESDDDNEQRATAISLMIYGADQTALETANDQFDKGIENLDPELRASVVSAVVRHYETQQLVDSLLELYRTTSSVDLQFDITLGLTSTRSQSTASRLLELIKDPETIRPQDAIFWFVYLVRGRDTRSLAWQWLKNNWPWVKQTFGGDKSYDDFIRYSASALMTAKELQEFKDFCQDKKHEPGLKRTIELGEREIAARVELIMRDHDQVELALQNWLGQR